jgi:hypothetical protein
MLTFIIAGPNFKENLWPENTKGLMTNQFITLKHSGQKQQKRSIGISPLREFSIGLANLFTGGFKEAS